MIGSMILKILIQQWYILKKLGKVFNNGLIILVKNYPLRRSNYTSLMVLINDMDGKIKIEPRKMIQDF